MSEDEPSSTGDGTPLTSTHLSSAGSTVTGSTDADYTSVSLPDLSSSISPNTTLSTRIHVSTPYTGGSTMKPGEAAAIAIFVVALTAAVLLLYYYLRRSGKLERLKLWSPFGKPIRRRGSTSSSRRPLEPEGEDDEDMVDLPRPTEGDLFTIGDLEEVDVDDRSQNALEDDYFYDEVFGSSAFEDETTNKSLKQLTSVSLEEELSVPDLIFKD